MFGGRGRPPQGMPMGRGPMPAQGRGPMPAAPAQAMQGRPPMPQGGPPPRPMAPPSGGGIGSMAGTVPPRTGGMMGGAPNPNMMQRLGPPAGGAASQALGGQQAKPFKKGGSVGKAKAANKYAKGGLVKKGGNSRRARKGMCD